MSALLVVIIDEHDGLMIGDESPARSENFETGKVLAVVAVKNVPEHRAVTELDDVTCCEILRRADRLAAVINDFLVGVGVAIKFCVNGPNIIGGNMFGGVDPEPRYADIEKILKVSGDRVAHVFGTRIEVWKAIEFAILDDPAILISVNLVVAVSAAVVKIPGGISTGKVVIAKR